MILEVALGRLAAGRISTPPPDPGHRLRMREGRVRAGAGACHCPHAARLRGAAGFQGTRPPHHRGGPPRHRGLPPALLPGASYPPNAPAPRWGSLGRLVWFCLSLFFPYDENQGRETVHRLSCFLSRFFPTALDARRPVTFFQLSRLTSLFLRPSGGGGDGPQGGEGRPGLCLHGPAPRDPNPRLLLSCAKKPRRAIWLSP